MISSPAVAVNATDDAASDHPSSPIPLSVTSDLPVPNDDATQLSGVRGRFSVRSSLCLTALPSHWKLILLA